MAWRRAVAQDLAPSYERLMHLTNQGAVLNGFSDGGAMWRSPYDLSIEGGRAKLTDLRQLFQLHAYVRRQLAGIYGIEKAPQLTKDGPIPAHLLSLIAGDSWIALYHETKPFDSVDIRSEQILENLQRLNYTAK
uniref:Uncharacterized protein n=1 Tax=Parascaris equorum TaxID=6256 RepID=A0A914RNW3_PAREQ